MPSYLLVVISQSKYRNSLRKQKNLIYKDFRLIFNDKKKAVGRYDCINLLFLICERAGKRCVKWGKNSEKVYDFTPLSVR